MVAVLGPALAGLAKKEVAEKLANGFKDLKDFASNSDTMQLFQLMKEFGVNIQPLLAPLSLITSQINMATTPAIIAGMKEMFELMQQPMVITVVEKIGQVFTVLIESATVLIEALNKVLDLLEESPKWKAFCDDCKRIYDMLEAGLADKWKEFVDAVDEKPNNVITAAAETIYEASKPQTWVEWVAGLFK